MLDLLRHGQKQTFDQHMAPGPSDPAIERRLAFRARPYGAFDSAYDLFRAVGKYVLDKNLVAQITTPTLVTDPDDEEFWHGQPREMFDLLQAPKQLARFTREDGAGHHCQPLGRTLTTMTVNDFFADHLPKPSASTPGSTSRDKKSDPLPCRPDRGDDPPFEGQDSP